MNDTLSFFAEHRCSAILRTPFAEAVAPAMEAAVEGGFRVVEFTLTTPNALEHIADFAARDGLVVGAGTVLEVAQVEAVKVVMQMDNEAHNQAGMVLAVAAVVMVRSMVVMVVLVRQLFDIKQTLHKLQVEL